MRDDPLVIQLVARARDGDQRAWDAIVERYAPLIWSVCMRLGLSRADTDDVGQVVWLRLIEHLDRLREPAALPGWLKITTQRECLRVLGAARSEQPIDTADDSDLLRDQPAIPIDEEVLRAERDARLRAAFAELPEHCQRLLSMLMSDPPHPYATICAALNLRPGSVGPQRARCLERLRRSPVIKALLDSAEETAGQDTTTNRSTGGGAHA